MEENFKETCETVLKYEASTQKVTSKALCFVHPPLVSLSSSLPLYCAIAGVILIIPLSLSFRSLNFVRKACAQNCYHSSSAACCFLPACVCK